MLKAATTGLVISSLFLVASVQGIAASAGVPGGVVRGRVLSAADSTSLPSATVITLDESRHAVTDAEGRFALFNLPLGSSVIQVSHVGYHTTTRAITIEQPGDSVTIDFVLEVHPATLRDITVSPGRFSIMGNEPVSAQTLTRGELQTLPQFSDDLYRAVQRLPGLASNDFSARFAVRGGEQEEVLVTLDGLEIYEPFHLKDIDGGVFSIVDASVIQKVDLMTGAFPADYGDRLSAVFGLTSRSIPVGVRRFSVGISFSNVRAASEGTFAGGRGNWLFSARRGYVDLVLKLAGESDKIKPTYYDVYGRLQYQLNGHHVLTANALGAWDNLYYYGDPDDDYFEYGDSIRTSYDNGYVWMTLHSQWHSRITSTSLLSLGRVSHRRWAQSYYWSVPGVDYRAHDNRSFDFSGLRSDWEYDLSERLLVTFGAEGRWMQAEYDYLSESYRYFYATTDDSTFVVLSGIDSIQAALAPSGSRLGSYATARFQPVTGLTAELGVRYDHVSYTGDDVWSPRFNLVYEFDAVTAVRAGWGRFYQSQRIDGIAVGERETSFGAAERADHYMVGYEHQFERGLNMRLEAYYKRYRDLRPQPRNTFDPIAIFPEAEGDRTLVFREKTIARGLELYLKSDQGGRFSWWGSYAYARVEDSIEKIRFFPEDVTSYQGEVLPNPRDQRHTLYLDLIYRPGPAWQINLALQYHTGVPFTDAHLASRTYSDGRVTYWVQGDKQWSARRDEFKRVDIRVNRHFNAWGGRITTYIELVNIFNTKNVRGYQYDIGWNGSAYYLIRDAEYWFGRLPSIGAFYEITL